MLAAFAIGGRRRALQGMLAALLVAGSELAPAADDTREDRWAQEVVPSLVVGEPVYLATSARPRVLAILTRPDGVSKGGVVVVHGLGVHPDWGLIGGVRGLLADAGFTTLSVQMPVLAADAPRDDYAGTFVEAGDRIAAAAAWLHAHGSARVALVTHSMGAAMANAYLARPDALALAAWAPVGMPADFAIQPREPVLDVLAEREMPQVNDTAPLRLPRLPRDRCSRQITIAGTDHYFENRQKELAAAIVGFLERAFAGGC